MLLLVLLAVASSLGRVPIEATHPVLAGPRYFFYPAVTILWALLWLAARAPRHVSAVAAALVGVTVPSALLNFTGMSWTPERPWSEQAMACSSAAAPYTFDIQIGLDTSHWHETLEPPDCQRLAATALLH